MKTPTNLNGQALPSGLLFTNSKSSCSMSKLISPSNVHRTLFLLLFLSLFFIPTFNVLGQTVVPVNPPTGGFAIDGDLTSDTAGDWVDGGGTGGYVLFNNNGNWEPIDPNNTQFKTDPYNSSSDNSFTGGSSFGDNPNDWSWTSGKPTSKCDINTVILHQTTDGSDKWLMLAGDRLTTNGTSYIDFEFSQGIFTKNDDGTFSSVAPNGDPLSDTNGRTPNDFVLSMEYSNGGTNATVHFYVWQLDGNTYKYVEQTIPAEAYGATNGTSETSVPFEAFGSSTYIPYAFVEAAVNIDDILTSNCLQANIRTIFVKTKASDSYNAALKDFLDPIPVNYQFGSAQLNYDDAYCAVGTATPYVSESGGTFDSSPSGLVWSNQSSGVIDLAGSTPGTYVITYTPTSGVCLNPATDTVTINPLPTASITGTASVCQNDTSPNITFTGADGSVPYTFTYKINGGSDQTISTTGENTSVTVSAPTGTVGNFEYSLVSVSDSESPNCSQNQSGSATITVNPNPTSDAGAAQAKCQGESGSTVFTLSGSASNGSTSWTVDGTTGTAALGSFDDSTSPTTDVTLTGVGTVTLKLTTTSGYDPSCGTAESTVVLTVNPNPSLTASVTQPTCSSPTGTIAVTSDTTGLMFSLDSTTPSDFTNANGVFNGLTAGSYTIRAINASGCISEGVTKIIDPVADAPSTPIIQVVQAATCSSAEIILEVVSPLDDGIVDYQYSNAGGLWQDEVQFTINAGDGFSIIARRKDDTSCVSDAALCDEPVEERVIQNDTPKQNVLETELLQPSIKAYPNPFNNQVNFKIDIPSTSEGELVLMNLLGQKIKTVYKGEMKEGTNNFEVILPSLNSGNTLIYILSIGGERYTGKLIQLQR